MANPADSGRDGAVATDDGVLTAYLDGELGGEERAALEQRFLQEPALKVRLDQLGHGSRAFGAAYEALLALAPADRMRAKLSDLVVAGRAAVARRPQLSQWSSLVAIAAAIVIFVLGGLAGYLAPIVLNREPEPAGWRQVVAEYQGLMTTETLAAISTDQSAVSQALTLVGTKLAHDLSPDKLVLPKAELKRADLLEFRGRPLVQLAYLTAQSGPIAFCIIADGRPDEGRAFEEREGFNIVFWADGGRSYMLIGKAPRAALESYADDLAARV
jgi:anti-sigma factor RsiW